MPKNVEIGGEKAIPHGGPRAKAGGKGIAGKGGGGLTATNTHRPAGKDISATGADEDNLVDADHEEIELRRPAGRVEGQSSGFTAGIDLKAADIGLQARDRTINTRGLSNG